MVKHAFLSILKKHLRRIRRCAKSLSRACRQGTLHELRVDLKQLRAHLRLLRAVDPAFPYPEVYAPFKALFAQAGQLRFWQLQATLFHRTAPMPDAFAGPYRHYLRRQRFDARQALRESVSGAVLPEWKDLKAEFCLSVQQCAPAAVQAYFDTLRQSIALKSQHPTRRRRGELHELRKWLKEYESNRLFAVKHLNVDPGPPPGIPADSSTFMELLGEWHDLDAACMQLAGDLREQAWEDSALKGGKEVLHIWKKKEYALWSMVRRELRQFQ